MKDNLHAILSLNRSQSPPDNKNRNNSVECSSGCLHLHIMSGNIHEHVTCKSLTEWAFFSCNARLNILNSPLWGLALSHRLAGSFMRKVGAYSDHHGDPNAVAMGTGVHDSERVTIPKPKKDNGGP